MKISRLIIKGYRQFKNTSFDFRNPTTLEPCDKICLIGRNGTGKSNLLEILNGLVTNSLQISSRAFVLAEIQIGHRENIYVIRHNLPELTPLGLPPYTIGYIDSSINEKGNWIENLPDDLDSLSSYLKNFSSYFEHVNRSADIQQKIRFSNNSNDLVIFSPSESQDNSYVKINDVPSANVNNALRLIEEFPYNHVVSSQNVNDFWKILIYLIKKRDSERELFENSAENINKTKKQLIEEFDRVNPKILDKLAGIWNKILDKAGLEFDQKNASNPIQLTDNLRAYIKLKNSNQIVNYNELSTGIRNFIFRVGHIYSLFFNREIKKGFLLIDEPENSLFPDFLFDLVETYIDLVKDINGSSNTQLFMATHSPIVAAQFQPYERIILDWEDDGNVVARKGISPVGDDPNDILSHDFELANLMGKEGQKAFQRYVELKKALTREENPTKKEKLLSEISQLGNIYNF